MTSYHLMNINDLGATAMSSPSLKHLVFHRGASILKNIARKVLF